MKKILYLGLLTLGFACQAEAQQITLISMVDQAELYHRTIEAKTALWEGRKYSEVLSLITDPNESISPFFSSFKSLLDQIQSAKEECEQIFLFYQALSIKPDNLIPVSITPADEEKILNCLSTIKQLTNKMVQEYEHDNYDNDDEEMEADEFVDKALALIFDTNNSIDKNIRCFELLKIELLAQSTKKMLGSYGSIIPFFMLFDEVLNTNYWKNKIIHDKPETFPSAWETLGHSDSDSDCDCDCDCDDC